MSYTWVPYYKELALKLLDYHETKERKKLIEIIKGLDNEYISFLTEEKDKNKIIDIHPFFVFSIFNRLVNIDKKNKILTYFKNVFNLSSPLPEDYDGIPSIDPRQSFWCMPWRNDYPIEGMEENWKLVEIALSNQFNEKDFCNYFDRVRKQSGAKWNVTQSLFRMNPDRFLSIDGNSREYLEKKGFKVFDEKELNGKNYLDYIKKIDDAINKKQISDNSYLEISYNSWLSNTEKKVWLLTWNPKNWEWTDFMNVYLTCKDGKRYPEGWSCQTKQAHPDDEFYLIKLGTEPRGIIAHGFITSNTYEAEHYDPEKAAEGITRNCVDIEFDQLINFETEPFLAQETLVKEIPEQQWSPQGSGIEIKKTGLTKLRELWKEIAGEKNMSINNEISNLLLKCHNIILHGAPGTGKSYMAKEIAKEMGAEVGFVQFHPSYDYTDFVEGLRPVKNEQNSEVIFERRNGVFKTFCSKALESSKFVKNDNFDEAWNSLLKELDEKGKVTIKTLTNTKTFSVVLNMYENGLVDSQEGYSRFYNYKQLYNVYQGKKGVPNGGHDNYRKAVIKYLKENHNLKDYEADEKTETKKNYVFIIDEINRGELSKIFGELFYNIDPGYRGTAGKINTQYQNLIEEDDPFYEGFYIPENVYIIGTMNDIDRSVESMDFAFRRRFTFKEITAKDTQEAILSELDDETRKEAIKRMDSLNYRIWHKPEENESYENRSIEGLSSAYHIGGAYFLKLKDLENSFENLWEYHLSGLLREYLRGMEDAEDSLEKLHKAYNLEN